MPELEFSLSQPGLHHGRCWRMWDHGRSRGISHSADVLSVLCAWHHVGSLGSRMQGAVSLEGGGPWSPGEGGGIRRHIHKPRDNLGFLGQQRHHIGKALISLTLFSWAGASEFLAWVSFPFSKGHCSVLLYTLLLQRQMKPVAALVRLQATKPTAWAILSSSSPVYTGRACPVPQDALLFGWCLCRHHCLLFWMSFLLPLSIFRVTRRDVPALPMAHCPKTSRGSARENTSP